MDCASSPCAIHASVLTAHDAVNVRQPWDCFKSFCKAKTFKGESWKSFNSKTSTRHNRSIRMNFVIIKIQNDNFTPVSNFGALSARCWRRLQERGCSRHRASAPSRCLRSETTSSACKARAACVCTCGRDARALSDLFSRYDHVCVE